jgi:hypothetical protein
MQAISTPGRLVGHAMCGRPRLFVLTTAARMVSLGPIFRLAADRVVHKRLFFMD